ncbi:MAG TPA: PspC domain-containing protein [Pseudonocardiaceae bacterium]|jgi:phage shock protein PspC (stress-responsive transcriptional regulator)
MSAQVVPAILDTVSGNEQASAPVADTAKDFWANRPRRPQDGRIVAGVAAGIGRRYGIDPIIIRIALIVATFFGGVGVLFYLLGWLLLPAEQDEVSPAEALIGRGRSATSAGLTILLGIALIPAITFFTHGDFSTYLVATCLVVGLFLLHRGRADHQYALRPTANPAQMPTTATGFKGDPMTDQTRWMGQPPATEQQQPPAWDPLGAAPFAWDLPEPQPTAPQPEPELPPQPRHKSRIGLATLGFAVAAGAAMFATGAFTPHIIVGILAGIVGLGMVAGAFLGGGRGLIPLAALLCCFGVILTVSHVSDTHNIVDDATYRPTAITAVQPSYNAGIGDLTLDLSRLPNTGTVNTTVSVGTGNARVLVPANADVVVTCHAPIGNVDCLDMHENGANNDAIHATQNDPSDNLKITLDVNASIGNVEVTKS